MKTKIDITLRTLHVGECRRVVTLGINGKDHARKFLEKLKKDDERKWQRLVTRIESVSNFLKYENECIFKYIGQGIYEFKRPGLRLYAFYDELGEERQLILCTNGGTKNSKKEQQSDIAKAKALKKKYEAAKTNPKSNLIIKEKP